MQPLAPIAPKLLEWFYQNRRPLPFRLDPSPYHIWVSEIMLQQTRVAAALEYYDRFTKALPTVAALAACDEEKLHKLWQGLGYYSRVRNMQKAAKLVVEQYGGELPGDYDALLALPGIGEYTAGAIASIAFGLPAVAVDGNVLRVYSRLLDCHDDITLPATKRALSEVVAAQQPKETPGDYNEALMELGALVCTPGTPNCGICPLQRECCAYAAGTAAALPVKAPKKAKTQHRVCLIVAHSPSGVLLQQRGETGLLAGLWQPLLWEGEYTKAEAQALLQSLLPGAKITGPLPDAKHIFTHRVWNMYGWQATLAATCPPPAGCVWASGEELADKYPIPSAFRAFLPALQGRYPVED